MKVGDKVKVVNRHPDNDTGAFKVLLTNAKGVGVEGYITEIHGDEFIVEGDMDAQDPDQYLGIFPPQDLELLPQTQELTLEDVYTVAPQLELREVIDSKSPKFSNPEYKGVIVEDTCDLIWWDVEDNCLNGVGEEYKDKHIPNHTEVSIPKFLELLSTYSPRKKEVKVQLNDLLEAVVDTDKEVVNVYYGHPSKHREPNPFTFQQLLDFQQALKGGGHGFVTEDYYPSKDSEVSQFLLAYAKGKKVPVSVHVDPIKYPNLCWYEGELGTTSEPLDETENYLTIDQFLAKCQSSPPPKLAGYEVKKVKEGEVYYSDKKAPSDGLGVGCQHIPNTQFEALMDAITTTK